MSRRVLRLVDTVLQSAHAQRLVRTMVRGWSSGVSRLPAEDGLRRLFAIVDDLQLRIDALAIELDGGVHAKHRLIGYHEFFVERVQPGERVLDVGCGKGELAFDLATRVGAFVTGIDRSRASIDFARIHYANEKLEFIEADALLWLPEGVYDAVVLSNVLEHIAPRVELLRRLIATTGATRLLIRVPSRERDWTVPLRRELGISHFSDPTHETEYTVDQLRAELDEAGLRLDELVQRWGELWAVAPVIEPLRPGLS